jgi:glucose-1-phosphate cytidylyltransferase
MHQSDMSVNLRDNTTEYHNTSAEPWRVTLIDTGLNTMTGGRIKRIQEYVNGQSFLLTYGDGLSTVDISKLVDFHRKKKRFATLTAVQPSGKFGSLGVEGDRVACFQEKPKGDGAWINGGFFVLEPNVFDYIKDGDTTIWERGPLEGLASDGELGAYYHEGFWQPMDTLRDKNELERLWGSDKAPWKVWA